MHVPTTLQIRKEENGQYKMSLSFPDQRGVLQSIPTITGGPEQLANCLTAFINNVPYPIACNYVSLPGSLLLKKGKCKRLVFSGLGFKRPQAIEMDLEIMLHKFVEWKFS